MSQDTTPNTTPNTDTPAAAQPEDDRAAKAAAFAEQNLSKKRELLAAAQDVVAKCDWRAGGSELRRIFDEWRQVPYQHTKDEDALWVELQAARQAFYDARDAAHAEAEKAKTELVAQAQKLADSTEWRSTGERFHELMDQWKAAGSAGREKDDALWEQSNGFQHAFFERRSTHYREMDKQHAENKKAKEALIQQAREASDVAADWGAAEWKAANNRMRDLMNEWKKVGQAARADNDRLWEEFNGLRQKFFDAQHAHHEELEAQYQQNAAAKQALVDEAQRLADTKDYGRENTEAIKQLDVKWKAIGYAGREKNDALWEAFRTAKEGFWDAKHAYNDRRHDEWLQKSQEAAERRRGQIENLEGQIERLESRIAHATVTTSESQLNEMQSWIDEKKERIASLQKEIADIEARLSK